MTNTLRAALSGRRIVLGVSGSIAAYKAADLASRLVQSGADVFAILTAHAAEFVGPATFRALTRNPVLSGVFDEPFDRQIAHIELAQDADLLLVAPATANVVAKMAHGIADDMLTTVLLAATAPVVVAPAMNTAMWEHPATQANMAILRARGAAIVEPGVGMLACGTEGPGRLADVQDILQAVAARLARRTDYAGVRVLVTAGPTREPLDPVRYLTNRSSGRMGFAIAAAAAERGASVTLVSGPTALPAPDGVRLVQVETTEQMMRAAEQAFADADVMVAAGAPCDYSPVAAEPQKIKKDPEEGTLTVPLRQTPDIVGTLARGKGQRIVVGFAAETQSLVANAAEKLARKGLDLVVANDVTAPGAGFDVETNAVTFVWPDGRTEPLDCMPKRAVADAILDRVRPLLTVG